MPIYEYQCQACKHQLEQIQKISDPPLTDCPECKEPALKKKISAAAFRLSGSGWYETDFKKGGNKKNLVEKGDASSKESGSKTTSDSKSSSGSESPKASSGGDKAAKSSTTKE